MRYLQLIVLLCLVQATCTAVAYADQITLKDGRIFNGKVVSSDTTVKLYYAPRSYFSFEQDEIKQIDHSYSAVAEYEDTLANIHTDKKDDIPAMLSLAKFATQHNFSTEAITLYKAIINLETDHVIARTALKYKRTGEGPWFKPETKKQSKRNKKTKEQADEQVTKNTDSNVSTQTETISSDTSPKSYSSTALDSVEAPYTMIREADLYKATEDSEVVHGSYVLVRNISQPSFGQHAHNPFAQFLPLLRGNPKSADIINLRPRGRPTMTSVETPFVNSGEGEESSVGVAWGLGYSKGKQSIGMVWDPEGNGGALGPDGGMAADYQYNGDVTFFGRITGRKRKSTVNNVNSPRVTLFNN